MTYNTVSQAAYRRANRARRLQGVKDWQAANPVAHAQQQARYYQSHRLNILQQRKDRAVNDPISMRETWCEKDATRRARAKGAFVERVYRAVVFNRDHGLCGECNLPVSPESWHLDHIIPLARGGEHSYANTQVTHPVCNMRKGVH